VRAQFVLVVLATGVVGACSFFSSGDDLTSPPQGAYDAGLDVEPLGEVGDLGEAETSDTTLADAGTDADGADGADGADVKSICPGTGGPPGVPVGTYCIDATEVTNAQYLAYLVERKGDTSGQNPQCGWNTGTYALQPYDPWPVAAGLENYPVVGVDWCDALAFCKYYGKRLCGRIGGGGLTMQERDDATKSQWYAACSHQADSLHKYSCGNDLVDGGCNLSPSSGPAAVGTRPCEGGFPGVHDLSGNVAEWEDACDPYDPDAGLWNPACLRRGGAWTYLDTCATNFGGDYPPRTFQSGDTGFRCCADL
jgi:formylglycine-generating enzyme required for sulfatase activity